MSNKMTYLQWNNAIGRSLFNEDKSEQPIYLFITRHDIIEIGRATGLDSSDEEVFSDFLSALRNGIPGTPKVNNILDQSLYAFTKWKQNPSQIDGTPVQFPLYLSYLILFILPLTENHNSAARVDAYYPPLNLFLTTNRLPNLPRQNENSNWNKLWEDLEEWTIIKQNTALGIFELHPFANAKWVYVGKPLSQCVFPPHALKALPQLFDNAGLIPGEEYTEDQFRETLLKYSKGQLAISNKTLSYIQDADNELGQSIINIVKKTYRDWTGVTDRYDEAEDTTRKGYTIAQLRLCLEGDKIKGYKSYYRLYSKLTLPEDLEFTFNAQKTKCQQIANGWSKPMFLPFQDSIELEDRFNKWKAKLPYKNTRLFIPGANFHLSGWVEVPFLVTTRMLLLAENQLSKSIEEWGALFEKGNFSTLHQSGVSPKYTLYELNNPPIGHPDVPALQFKPDSEKSLQLVGGIKIGTRRWLKDLLPEVELENGLGNEKPYLRYQNTGERIYLYRKQTDQPLWVLPANISLDTAFYIEIEGLSLRGSQLLNYITQPEKRDWSVEANALPIKNKFGQITQPGQNTSYVQGRELVTTDERSYALRQNTYSSGFLPKSITEPGNARLSSWRNDYNEILLTFLAGKGPCSAKEYFEAFDAVYQAAFTPEEIEGHPIELSKIKSWSLNYLDFMGFLDYEYSPKRSTIVVNPPHLVLIPTNTGRKALLAGGRTPALIEQLVQSVRKRNLYLACEKQDSSLTSFLLPRTVTVSGFSGTSGHEITMRIKALADDCLIPFNETKLPQFRLVEFSCDIEEYSNTLSPYTHFDDSGWPAKKFDADQLTFIPITDKSFDKAFTLVEYKLTEYNLRHILWINGIPHNINKNWGRYMILRHQGKNVIFIDKDRNLLAIPVSTPLPMLLSEAMTLLSGMAPKQLFLNIDGIRAWYTLYENIPPLLAYNYFLKIGQKQKETSIL